MLEKLKRALVNLSLVLVSLAITYFIAELVFFRLLLPQMSLNLKTYLPDRADVVTQNSKAGYLPHDYIALLGDSFAEGLGDWLLAARGNRALPFHSANVLHDLLGKDVVSLGRGGYGSAESIVQKPTRVYGNDHCYLFPQFEEPRRFLIYFHEGNDVDDNHFLAVRVIKPDGSDVGAGIDKFLNENLGVAPLWRCHAHLAEMAQRMANFVLRYYSAEGRILDLPEINRAIIAGAPTGIGSFELPSMTLRDDAMDLGVLVFDRSLAWLRRRFPRVPVTVVYIGSAGALYRYVGADVIAGRVYLPDVPIKRHDDPGRYTFGPKFSTTAVYANSQKICEKVRAATIRQGATFIDTRPEMRRTAAQRAIHGPRDWYHFNETGYRVLGRLLADRIGDPPIDACDDRWPP